MIARVISIKTNNTATVVVSRIAMHPLYKKTFTRTKKYLVDAGEGVKEGDVVEIIKVRPISKNKHWKITKVVGKDLEEITKKVLKTQAEKIISEVMPEEKEESSVESPAEGEARQRRQESGKEEIKNQKLKKGENAKTGKEKKPSH